MRLYLANDGLILQEGCRAVKCHRSSGTFSKFEGDVDGLHQIASYCGEVKCLIGILQIGADKVLFFVLESSTAAFFHDSRLKEKCPIERVDRVIGIGLNSTDVNSVKSQLRPTANKLKHNTEKFFRFLQDKIGTNDPGILSDVLRLFNDSKDFYFCPKRDITLSAQRYFTASSTTEDSFFWNRYMVEGLFDDIEDNKKWACPLIQGFVATANLDIVDQVNTSLTITIISRRSTHRSGTRYLRRGIDEKAFVANFVETEVLLNIFDHELSFVQIRGSAPMFWSQRGMRYRPPLSLDRSVEQTQPFFEQHFGQLFKHYGTPIAAINLVNQQGRELQLAQRFLEHVIKFNQPDLTYVSFDLHQHCRGLNFTKLKSLVESLDEKLKKVGFCWVDKTGQIVQKQKGTIRVNCVDCLDRTNLVQGVISQYVCLRQAQRLGIFGPLSDPPESLIKIVQALWADNGDAISTQYAGTAALKGDVTRSGERKFAGMVKDGYNSASRYYLNIARDAARQRAINAVTRQTDSVPQTSEPSSDSEEEENLARLVSETVQFLVPQQNIVVAGWGLVNACNEGDDVDTVVTLTKNKLYVTTYELDSETMSDVQIMSLEDIVSIEVGRASSKPCVRLKSTTETFIWRPSKIRLFNNVALRLKSDEDTSEYISSVAEQINVAKNMHTGFDESVNYLTVPISLPKKRYSALGSMLTRMTGKLSSDKTLRASASQPTNIGEVKEVEVSGSANKADDFMKKLLNRKNEEPVDPFAQLRSSIPNSQSVIMLL